MPESFDAAAPKSALQKLIGATWRDRLAGQLLRVRPAPLAVLLKRALRIERHVVETADGKLWIDPATLFGARIIRTGEFEPSMKDCLKAHLRPGTTFVDLGANEGYFTIIAATLVGPQGRVLAIEPQARLQPVIARNVSLNGFANVVVEPSAISDHVGTATFHLAPETLSGGSGFVNMARYNRETVNVPVNLLSSVFEAHAIGAVDLMKVDIEGAEYEALLGSQTLFESHRIKAMALELHPAQLAARGRVPADIEVMLTTAGYALSDADGVWTVRG